MTDENDVEKDYIINEESILRTSNLKKVKDILNSK